MRLIRGGRQMAVHTFFCCVVKYLIFGAMNRVFSADLVLRVDGVS